MTPVIDTQRRQGYPETQLGKPHSPLSSCGTTFFSQFRDVQEISHHIQSLAAAASSSVSLTSLGRTNQGQEIPLITLHLGKENESLRRSSSEERDVPVVLVVAGLHGREWISVSSVIYVLNELGKRRETMKKRIDVVIVPMGNPDGYAKTFGGGKHNKEKFVKGVVMKEEGIPDRYWRKNGRGVDLNRNFGPPGTVWGVDNTTKSMKLPNADVYEGKSAFSEVETDALRRLTSEEKLGNRLVAFVDFHCCIGAVLAPPLGTRLSSSHPSVLENERVGRLLVDALSRGGSGVKKFQKGDGEPGKYTWRMREPKDRASGTSSAWSFHELALDLAYVVELRGKFVAPCYEIPQIGKEVLFALLSLIENTPDTPRSLQERKQSRHVSSNTANSDASSSDLRRTLGLLVVVCVLVMVMLLAIMTKSNSSKRKISP